MLKEFADKKETFLDYKKQNFQKSKNSYFAKGVNPRFWSEKCQFFLYLFLVKTRLEIILNAFVEKKETFFDYNKLSQKLLFPKGVIPRFGHKMPIFLFMLIILMKIRLEIMLSDFAEKKETCFEYKNRIFQSPKNPLFQRG